MTFNQALFSATIKSHLLQHNLSLRDASRASGVSVSTISRLANGDLPDVETFATVIHWLELDANSFLSHPTREMLEQDSYKMLFTSLYELGVAEDLIKAIVTIIRLVMKGK